MVDRSEHADWRARVAAAVVDRRPPESDLANHLAGCASCADEWRRLSGASARLISAARSLPLDAQPSALLREQAIAALGDRRDVAVGFGRPVRHRRSIAALDQWRSRLAWGGVGALVGAAAMVVAIAGTQPGRSAGLTLTGTALAPAASGSAAIANLADGTVSVTLAVSGLPASGPSDFYELWFVGDQGRISAGTFRADGSPLRLMFLTAADLVRYPRIGITREPDDGNPAASDARVAGST
ncbi:MAG: anti-sigma factor [Candidatus Limnocylindrales bacterium]